MQGGAPAGELEAQMEFERERHLQPFPASCDASVLNGDAHHRVADRKKVAASMVNE